MIESMQACIDKLPELTELKQELVLKNLEEAGKHLEKFRDCVNMARLHAGIKEIN